MRLFNRTKQLESWIDELLNTVSEAGLVFCEAIKLYLGEGVSERYDGRLKRVTQQESRGDELRREIEQAIYRETLIPDSRRDVLQLLEALDDIINRYQEVLWYFSIETPEIPDALNGDYQELTEQSTEAVERLVLATRAFFREPETVSDHLHKVRFYESQADETVTRLRQRIFSTDLPLPNKIHLRFFAERIVWISDLAEDVADQLVIYSIKRSV
jgi:predicted phosphate transport protein (TIGR00153 family)